MVEIVEGGKAEGLAELQGIGGLAVTTDPLRDLVLDYIRAAKAPSTVRAYGTNWRQFEAWCTEQEVQALPASPETVARYLASLGGHLRPQTLARRLCAIAAAHKAKGIPSPASLQHELVGQTMKGIRRRHGVAQTRKTPLLTADIQRLLAHMGESPADLRDRALLLNWFAGAFRSEEIAGFFVGDVRLDEAGAVLHLRSSKMDQEGKGREVAIPRGAHAATCPVRALEAWLEALRAIAGELGAEAPLFPALTQYGMLRRRPAPMHPNSVREIVKRALVKARYRSEPYSGHSLRAGFCTQAARAGATAHDIMRQTGHTSVQTVARYIREAELFTQNTAGKLGL